MCTTILPGRCQLTGRSKSPLFPIVLKMKLSRCRCAIISMRLGLACEMSTFSRMVRIRDITMPRTASSAAYWNHVICSSFCVCFRDDCVYGDMSSSTVRSTGSSLYLFHFSITCKDKMFIVTVNVYLALSGQIYVNCLTGYFPVLGVFRFLTCVFSKCPY